jgi:hypothetical protein
MKNHNFTSSFAPNFIVDAASKLKWFVHLFLDEVSCSHSGVKMRMLSHICTKSLQGKKIKFVIWPK